LDLKKENGRDWIFGRAAWREGPLSLFPVGSCAKRMDAKVSLNLPAAKAGGSEENRRGLRMPRVYLLPGLAGRGAEWLRP
jgi:hypothetical protein